MNIYDYLHCLRLKDLMNKVYKELFVRCDGSVTLNQYVEGSEYIRIIKNLILKLQVDLSDAYCL